MKVLKFGAEWCPACVTMKPRWAEIEKEHQWLDSEYYDADQAEQMVRKHQVKDLPSFIFLDSEGNELGRMTGMVDKDKLIETIKKYRDK